MKEALVSIKSGSMKIRQASIKFNIPSRTLYDRLKKTFSIEKNYINGHNNCCTKSEIDLICHQNYQSEDIVLSLLLYGFEEQMIVH